MSSLVTFITLGFASGAIYVGLSLGLLTVYLSSGILNFAQAAIAMWGAYVFADLRTEGKLVLPVGTVHLGTSVAAAESLVLALATSIVLGLIFHLLVFRPLRHASPVSQIVASIGILELLVGLVEVRFGTSTVQVPSMLPQTSVKLGGYSASTGDLILVGLAMVLCIAIAAYFRFTTLGVATRASATNEDALALMGYNPNWTDAAAWTIASVVSTAVLILVAPTTSLDPTAAYLVVPALAVLLIAKLRSPAVVGVAGLGLGVAQSLLTLGGSKSWWPSWGQSGLQEALPFIVAIAILFILGRRITVRGAGIETGLPRVRLPQRPTLTLAVVAVVGVLGILFTQGQTRFGVVTSVIMAVLVLSYTVVTGYLGQISLAQIAFAGAAGFLLSKLTSDWGIGFPLSLVSAAVFAAFIGIVIGAASLRFSGAQFAIVTLAATVAVQAFIFENSAFTPLQGDPVGQPRIFGINLSIESGSDVARLPFGILALVVLLISAAVVMRWMRGRTGRMWLAVRDNERAAAASGVNVTAIKISGFAVSALLAGVAGCLLGYSQGQFSANSFTVDIGILIFAVAFMGGITSIGGAVAAGLIAPLGVVYVLLNNHINFGEYYPLVVGLSLVLTIVLNPDGVAGKTGQLMDQAATVAKRHRRAGGRGPLVVSLPTAAAIPTVAPADETGEVLR